MEDDDIVSVIDAGLLAVVLEEWGSGYQVNVFNSACKTKTSTLKASSCDCS